MNEFKYQKKRLGISHAKGDADTPISHEMMQKLNAHLSSSFESSYINPNPSTISSASPSPLSLEALTKAMSKLKETQGRDSRPFGDKTWLVYHPALRRFLKEATPPDPFPVIRGHLPLGMPTWETMTIYLQGHLIPMPDDQFWFVHEDRMSELIGEAWDNGPGKAIDEIDQRLKEYDELIERLRAEGRLAK